MIVGGGFIGLEVAATARSLGLDVTVIEAAPGLLSRMLPAALGEWFVDLHARNGVRIRCGAAVEEIVVGGGGHTVRLTDQTIAADIVLVGVGAAPEVGWLAGSGLEIADGVRCAPDLSVGAPGVVAAGDIARWHNAALGSEVRTEHWTNAVDQGRHAAGTLLGDRQAYSAVPYFWTDQYDAKARFVGQASADDEFAIGQPREGALVALFGRDGVVRGALCINAARHLATYRGAINERVAWRDAVSTLPN